MHDPALLPDPSGQGLEEVGVVAFEGLTEEGGVVIGEVADAGEVGLLGAAGHREQAQVACLPKPRRRQVGEAD